MWVKNNNLSYMKKIIDTKGLRSKIEKKMNKKGRVSDHCKEEEFGIIKRNQTNFSSYRFYSKEARKHDSARTKKNTKYDKHEK